MIQRIAVGDGDGLRVEVALLVASILATDGERGRIHMKFADAQAQAPTCLRCDPGKQGGRIVGVQPIERTPQALVVEVLSGDPWPEQVRDRFGLEELGDQIEAAIGEANPLRTIATVAVPTLMRS